MSIVLMNISDWGPVRLIHRSVAIMRIGFPQQPEVYGVLFLNGDHRLISICNASLVSDGESGL
jgi:hypothetical protein